MQETGGPEVLRMSEQPDPTALGPHEVLVRLRAAGVNPVDTKVRKRGPMLDTNLPTILGCDGAGVVEAIGSEARRFTKGDAVWHCHGGIGGSIGNYAELIVVDERLVQPKPDALSFEQAAAAPLVLITAWEALFDRACLTAGETVLIHGGAGGVGHVAIQLAKAKGARVCTTVSSPEKADFVHELGAECAINYREERLVDVVMDWTGGRGVDVALDTVGPDVFQQTIPAMGNYGDLVTILDPGPNLDLSEARNRNLRLSLELMLTPMIRNLMDARLHQGEILNQCARLMTDEQLKIHLHKSYPLAEAAAAHRDLESGGTTGKRVLHIT